MRHFRITKEVLSCIGYMSPNNKGPCLLHAIFRRKWYFIPRYILNKEVFFCNKYQDMFSHKRKTTTWQWPAQMLLIEVCFFLRLILSPISSVKGEGEGGNLVGWRGPLESLAEQFMHESFDLGHAFYSIDKSLELLLDRLMVISTRGLCRVIFTTSWWVVKWKHIGSHRNLGP